MSNFGKDVAATARRTGLVAGASAGVSTASTMYGTIASAGLLAAVPAAGTIFLTLPLLGGYLGWKACKAITDVIDSD